MTQNISMCRIIIIKFLLLFDIKLIKQENNKTINMQKPVIVWNHIHY